MNADTNLATAFISLSSHSAMQVTLENLS